MGELAAHELGIAERPHEDEGALEGREHEVGDRRGVDVQPGRVESRRRLELCRQALARGQHRGDDHVERGLVHELALLDERDVQTARLLVGDLPGRLFEQA